MEISSHHQEVFFPRGSLWDDTRTRLVHWGEKNAALLLRVRADQLETLRKKIIGEVIFGVRLEGL